MTVVYVPGLSAAPATLRRRAFALIAALLAAASSQKEELDRVRGERDQWQHNSYENAREVGRLRSELAAITGANAEASLARARADAI